MLLINVLLLNLSIYLSCLPLTEFGVTLYLCLLARRSLLCNRLFCQIQIRSLCIILVSMSMRVRCQGQGEDWHLSS